jgi:uncharacterized membrane protein YebE (DUF533 family)
MVASDVRAGGPSNRSTNLNQHVVQHAREAHFKFCGRGTAIVGGLAYKAYGNWQQNKALEQTQAITAEDIGQSQTVIPQQLESDQVGDDLMRLEMVLIKTMIAASKADGHIDAEEHKRLFQAIEELNLDAQQKAVVFDAMANDITVQEISNSVSCDEHKAEVYLAAYLAIEVDEPAERTFLNELSTALNLPKGFPAYLEQQADQGVAA